MKYCVNCGHGLEESLFLNEIKREERFFSSGYTTLSSKVNVCCNSKCPFVGHLTIVSTSVPFNKIRFTSKGWAETAKK